MKKVTKDITVINPSYATLRPWVEGISEPASFSAEEKIFEQRNRVYRHVADNGQVLSVKSFKIPPIINKVAYARCRHSKARKSYENSLRLLEAGIRVPEPIAYREVHRGIGLSESYYVCRHIDGLREVRNWQSSADAERIVDGVARLMAQLHSKGIYFRDFSGGNILYDADFNFYLVDVNRTNFECTNPATLFRNFRSINAEREEVQRLARAYCKYTPFTDIDPEDILENAVMQLLDYTNEKRWHAIFKRLLHRQ